MAYGGESGSELALTDSEGSSPAKTNCRYSDSRSYQQSNIAGTIFLSTPSWLPSEKARWVEVKGEVHDTKGYMLRVEVHSSTPLGFLDFELHSPDGAPLVTENYGSSSGRSLKSYDWGRYFRMQGKKQEELKVAVQYAEGLRKIMVPVRIRCGLSGAVEQQDTPNKEN